MRQAAVDRLGLEVEPATRVLPILRAQPEALLDVLGATAHDFVEEAARLARVPRHVGQAALVRVELLQRRDRQVDVVLVEAEQARPVVAPHTRAPRVPLWGSAPA